MLEELTALATIADIDTKVLQAETVLKEIPERIANLEGDVQRLTELLEAERQELAEAERLLKAQDQEIENQHQAMSRSKSKSARARNAREADAVERELEIIRRSLKDREGERDSLKQAIAGRQETLSKHERDLASLQEFAANEKRAADVKMAEVRRGYDEIKAGRDDLVGKVSRVVMRRYELIRERRGVAVSMIKAGSCVGCNVALAPQLVIKVQRGESLEHCPQCQRFLYSAANLANEADVASTD